jgi:hypothetical protein
MDRPIGLANSIQLSNSFIRQSAKKPPSPREIVFMRAFTAKSI